MIHPTAEVEDPNKLGNNCKVWHFSHIMPDVKIGNDCNIGQNVFIANQVEIGDNVKIQNNCSIFQGVKLQNNVFVGPSVVFTNVKYPRALINRKSEYVKTLVEKGASIGANSTIVCGIILGSYCLIGAGSVVVKDVDPYELIIGNPGTRIGWVSEFGDRLHFDKEGIALCHQSRIQYKKVNGKVFRLES